MRIFAISDLHADYPQNMALITSISGIAHRRDTLLLAGDVTDDLVKLALVLESVRSKFAHVFFVPGNHELWVRRGGLRNSVDKFENVIRLCAELGVTTYPAKVACGPDDPGAWVVPLFSWYTKPEDGSGSLYVSRGDDGPSLSMWADEVLTRWPDHLSVADYFLDMNEPHLHCAHEAPVLTLSHFLPRRELMFRPCTSPPGRRGRISRFNFSRVAGSERLETQIRVLGSVLHVYGHQHRNRDRVIEGVRYVSNCMGYPTERARGELGDPCGTLKLVRDSGSIAR